MVLLHSSKLFICLIGDDFSSESSSKATTFDCFSVELEKGFINMDTDQDERRLRVLAVAATDEELETIGITKSLPPLSLSGNWATPALS